ncbi:hypothetical protein BHM03_00052447, partial [Ensete ventricosum]
EKLTARSISLRLLWQCCERQKRQRCEVADSISDSGRSSKGRLSVAEEPAVLSLDSGRNCTWRDSERKLRARARSSDLSVDSKGRLGLLHLRSRQ